MKRKRAEQSKDAQNLADAENRLSLLQSKLDYRKELDREIKDLQATQSRLVSIYADLAEEYLRSQGASRSKLSLVMDEVRWNNHNNNSLLEEKRRMAEGLVVETILSDIEQTKSEIQELSRPTYIARVLSVGPPSTAEKEGLYKVQKQTEEPLYDCCFPAGAQPPLPLSLAHHVFGDFLDDFSNVSAPLDNDTCNFIIELCYDVLGRMQDFCNEGEFQVAFNLKLEGFIGHTVAVDVCHFGMTKFTTDTTVRANGKWTALGELKLEKGATLAQGLQSFAMYVGLHAETELLPCFFIEVIGATMRIGGLVFFEKVAWQPLTPFMNCFFTEHDRTDMITLGRAMVSLKKGLTALHSYYTEAQPSITPEGIPYPLQGRQSISRIGKKLVFIVTCDNGERRIVKYCRQYGEEVHKSWAEEGLAPLLYSCKLIAGGWLEVEMQHLTDWTDAFSLLKGMDEAARHKRQAAILSALERALSIRIDDCPVAHGDVRPPNVLIKGDEESGFDIKFIDFDWAGKVGVTRYPPFMNTELHWHADVGAGKLLQQEHDRWWWLENKVGAFSSQ